MPASRSSAAPSRRCATRSVNMDVPISLGVVAGARHVALRDRSTTPDHAYFDSRHDAAVLPAVRPLSRPARCAARPARSPAISRRCAPRRRSCSAPTASSPRCRPRRSKPATAILVRPGERMPADGVVVDGALARSTKAWSPARRCRARRRRASASMPAPSIFDGALTVRVTAAGAGHAARRDRAAARQGGQARSRYRRGSPTAPPGSTRRWCTRPRR